ncbi:MAG: hypothetical protein IT430_13160 [Phycisphaerales bacterium]|nr:hypothetical protein [Phycisphaerales bacterium]
MSGANIMLPARHMPERPYRQWRPRRAAGRTGAGISGPTAAARRLIPLWTNKRRLDMLNTFLLTDNRRRVLLLTILMFAALC